MAKFKNYFWPGRFATERTGNRGQDTGDRERRIGPRPSTLSSQLCSVAKNRALTPVFVGQCSRPDEMPAIR